MKRLEHLNDTLQEEHRSYRLAAAAPLLLKALQLYLQLDTDLAEDSVQDCGVSEGVRWVECQDAAAEALRAAGVPLPDWLEVALRAEAIEE